MTMSQPRLPHATAGPADERAAVDPVPDGAAEPAPDGGSPARSDAPFLLTLVAVAAVEAAALVAWIVAA
jgi:hypothetical protein